MNAAGLRMIEAKEPTEAEGRYILELVVPEHREAWRANHERVCHGETLTWEFDIIGLRGTRRRMETNATPLRLPDGQLAQLAIARDITARKESDERQVMLALEVDHRAKNALQVALSLVRMTHADDPCHFAAVVGGRIAALAHAHTLLAERGWSRVELRAVVEAELAPYLAAGRVYLQGPLLWVTPIAVQPLSIVLHELAANAARHGSLSTPAGRVEVAWGGAAMTGDQELRWAECGGPPPVEPHQQGIGLKLIEATTRNQLRGAARHHWEPGGLLCKVTIGANRLLPLVGGSANGSSKSAPSAGI